MNAVTKLAAYGAILAAVLGGGAAIGAAVGPIHVGEDPEHDLEHREEDTMFTQLPAAGLLVSQDGYTFAPEKRTLDSDGFAFMILGPDGNPVKSYEALHERELHLIVASRDLRHYTHVHPDRDTNGRWTVDLPALPAGSYRAFADFRPAGGRQYTLGIDLAVPGTVEPTAELRPQLVDSVDGYDITLDGNLSTSTEVTLTVRRDGQVVKTEPYLGAAGHLVALRDGDLAYLHVHPLDDVPDGAVRFAVDVPSTGLYAFFFDFKIEGTVRTARFAVDAASPTTGVAHHGVDTEH